MDTNANWAFGKRIAANLSTKNCIAIIHMTAPVNRWIIGRSFG